MEKEKSEYWKEITSYLGSDLTDIIIKMNQKEREYFNNLDFSHPNSFFVKGSPKQLNQFKACYLAKQVNTGRNKRPSKETIFLDELINSVCNHEGLSPVDILFIYVSGEGRSDRQKEWYFNTEVLGAIIKRNRSGYVTVVLSEVDIPILSESAEVITINLTKEIGKPLTSSTSDLSSGASHYV